MPSLLSQHGRMTTARPAWRRALNSAQNFVNDPDTKRFAGMGSKVLSVAAQLGQAKLSGPLGMAGAAVGFLDVLVNQSDPGPWKVMADYATKKGFVEIDANGAITMLYEQGEFADAEVLITAGDFKLASIPAKDGNTIAVVVSKDGKLAPYWPAFLSAGLNGLDLSEMLWKKLGTAVRLAFKPDLYGRMALSASTITGYDHDPYEGMDPGQFVADYHKLRAKGASCANLFWGWPGTGKTTFCYRVNELLGGRLMAITAEILSNKRVPHQDLLDMLTTFKPKVLLLDDVDHVKDGEFLLSLLDFIRRENPDTYVISTANAPDSIIESLRRPGRLGPRIEFPVPDLALRRRLITRYSQTFGIDRDITHLAEFMVHEKFSQDYVRDCCKQAIIYDDAALLGYIEDTKKYLGAPSEGSSGGAAPLSGSGSAIAKSAS